MRLIEQVRRFAGRLWRMPWRRTPVATTMPRRRPAPLGGGMAPVPLARPAAPARRAPPSLPMEPTPPATISASPSAPASSSPRTSLVRLRRAAACDAFRAAGWLPPPRLLWSFADTSDDVGTAVARFFVSLGYPLERLSQARVAWLLESILRAEAMLAGASDDLQPAPTLPAAQRRRALGWAIRSARQQDRSTERDWSEDGVPAALRNVRNIADRLPDAERRRLIVGAAHLDAMLRPVQRTRQDLLDHWPTAWSGTRAAAQLGGLLHAADAAERQLEAAASLTGDELREMVAVLARAELGLRLLAERAAKSGEHAPLPDLLDGDALKATPDPSQTAWGELLDRLDDGSHTEGRAAWRVVRWRCHPEAPRRTATERSECYRIVALADRLWPTPTSH